MFRVNANLISPLINCPIENANCKAYAIPMSWQLGDEEVEKTLVCFVFLKSQKENHF